MRKRMVVFGIVTFLAMIIFAIVYHDEPREINEEVEIYTNEMSATELFIQKYLLMENGMIRTNFSDRKDGKLALSESLGLWMDYLVAKGDMTQFDRAYKTMKEEFQLSNHLLSWKIEDGVGAKTNALIDDLRVIEALFKMGELTNNRDYIDEAVEMAKAIKDHHISNGYFVDFYDVEHEEKNDFTTISYLKPNALFYMEKYKILEPNVVTNMLTLLKQLPIENGFYPETYFLKEDRFAFEEEVNLIDQIYIGLHREQANVDSSILFDWLKETFYKENQLFGRYDAKTKKPTVTYESVAVYSLTIIYSLEKGDQIFAKDVYDRMIELRVADKGDPYFGGYVADDNTDTHSFDNLLASIAERKLKHAKVIP